MNGEQNYDVVILGTGPAGLQAAIHAARKKVSVLVVGKQHKSSPGIFAAGDICGPPRQVAKAIGEGCVAGIGAATHARKAARGEPEGPSGRPHRPQGSRS